MQPKPRGEDWLKKQELLFKRGHPTEGKILLIGDSLVNNLFRNCPNRLVWEDEFGDSYINRGVGGDRISHVLWRIGYHNYPPMICDTVVIQEGTNDLTDRRNTADDIANGILQIVTALLKNHGDITIILTGMLPGKGKPVWFIGEINYLLEKYCRKLRQVFYLKPDFKEWKNPDLSLKKAMTFFIFHHMDIGCSPNI